MKVHVGCGTVYLQGWLNLDIKGPRTFLARTRPDLKARYVTTEGNYYGRHTDKSLESLRKGPRLDEYVCDAYGDFFNLYAVPGHIDELLARHTWEHLSIREARIALNNIRDYMVDDGILRLDVPDHEQTLLLYGKTGDPFYIRHLLGPRRDEYGFHMMSYTPERLQRLVEEHGFTCEGAEENIHIYPAFCLRFRKI